MSDMTIFNEHDDDDDDDAVAAFSAFATVMEEGDSDDDESDKIAQLRKKLKCDHRQLQRLTRRKFDHETTLRTIESDFLKESSLWNGSQFKVFFRISRPRFQALLEDIGAANIPFYSQPTTKGPSREARLLLPLKTLAYGVAMHTFCDYFRMSFSEAAKCCAQFDLTIASLYSEEYLRHPTADDLKRIINLHRTVHGVPGMFCSLDCCHLRWKNCPKAWQGIYKGKEGFSSIVLEAACDYHLWFWHCSFGHPGTLNDINILNLSPLLQKLTSPNFAELETAAGVVPFSIGTEEFREIFLLVDGIYPAFARFVKAIKEPSTALEKLFSEWQEGGRKDVERGFGVLQLTFQFVARPIQLHCMEDIQNRVHCCIILHNMLVADRVMGGDPRAVYKPDHMFEDLERDNVQFPSDLQAVQGGTPTVLGEMGLEEGQATWSDVFDGQEHRRLNNAILRNIEQIKRL